MIPQDKIDVAIESFRDKKIFLTGGTGFFGRSLLDFLSKYAKNLPFKMVILSRNSSAFLESWPHYKNLSQVSFQDGDIQSLKAKDKNYDTILHFAAVADAKENLENPLEVKNVIVKGTEKVLEFAQESGASDILFTSSGAAYGKQPSDTRYISEDFFNTKNLPVITAYGEGKRLAEQIGCEHASRLKFNFKIARCFAFVGPHLNPNGSFAIGNIIKDALTGDRIKINGDGSPFRSYLYSEDLIVWLLNILFAGKNLNAYNVGSDQEVTIRQLAEKVKSLVNSNAELNVGQVQDMEKKPERYVPDTSKAKNELGLNVWTNLDQSILKTAKHFKGVLTQDPQE